jgi:hypothetical protein
LCSGSSWIMRVRPLIAAGLVLVVCGTGLVGCKKAKARQAVDPHSTDGIMLVLQKQGTLLNDALTRQDFPYLHDYGFYFTGLLQALFTKLDEGEKQRLRPQLDELVALAKQLDRVSGVRHAEAAEVTVKRIGEVLKDLDQQYHQVKHSG